MRSGGPKESAGTKHTRNFLQKQSRLGQVFEDLRRRYDVKMLRRKVCLLKFAVKPLETQFTNMLDRVCSNINTLSIPTILSRRLQKISGATTNVEQPVCFSIRR